jgi:RHS repeat-associated protein
MLVSFRSQSGSLVGSNILEERTKSFYDAADQLRAVDRQRCLTATVNPDGGVNGQQGGPAVCSVFKEAAGRDPSAFEEYRYDALGRRVLVRRYLYEINGQCSSLYHLCESSIERIVWDGDQILWEIRSDGSTSAQTYQMEGDNAAGDFLGRVGYTHGLGIDAPLDITRVGLGAGTMTVVPHANWRGMYGLGTFADGTTVQNGFGTSQLPWPANEVNAYMAPVNPSLVHVWFGSLITNQKDASGLLYRRNRQYDPATGRFTQEDPIGIAGGLNAYGFGGGDPVSYSDPYGLNCKDAQGHDVPCPHAEATHAVGGVGVTGTLIVGKGGTVSAGVFNSSDGWGPYLHIAGGVGNDVGIGVEAVAATSRDAFRGKSVGACVGLLGGGACVSKSPSGKSVSLSVTAGSRDIPFPVSTHVEAGTTEAPTFGEMAREVMNGFANAKETAKAWMTEGYQLMLRPRQ